MRISDFLNKDEVRQFAAKSDAHALWLLVANWTLIFAILFFVDSWTNPVTIVVALVLLAGRQLGLAVITHECGHNTFFNSRSLNRFCGQFLAANPTFQDMHQYASGHSVHHRLVGTVDDPDRGNYQAYPVSGTSFKRKMIRDLSGQTGLKLIRIVFAQARGVFSSDRQTREKSWPYMQQIAANLILAVVLGVLFTPWIYLLWIGAFMTTFMAIIRIRQVAEHAHVPNPLDTDPRQNTRTTIASWWERVCFAPNHVNYHLEHHIMASTPCYRLRALHELLKSRGAYADTRIFHGYREVLQHAVA
ncbi:MAG: fatty acid desaturase family protein [Pseudomonadales bacterium]